MSSKPLYFPQLDVLRFFAAFAIVVSHGWEAAMGWFYPNHYPQMFLEEGTINRHWWGNMFHHFIYNLPLGVDLFFLISGFLITYILLVEKQNYGKIDIPKFFIRRSLRIWPLYFLLIAVVPFLVTWLDSNPPAYWPNLLFYNNFSQLYNNDWTYPFHHFWSICVEEHFYLFWPFLVAFIPVKKLPYLFYGVIGCSILYRAYIGFTTDSWFWYTYLHTLARIDVMAVGALLAYYHHKKPVVFKPAKWIRVLVYLIFFLILCFDSAYQLYWDNMLAVMFKKYVHTAALLFIVMNSLFNPEVIKLPLRKVFGYFGKASYGLYMIHNFLMIIVIKKIMWPNGWESVYIFFAIYFGLALTIPLVSYELIERPILRLKQKFAKVQTRL